MKNYTRARKSVPVLDVLTHYTPMIGRQAEAWEVPVYIAFLVALQALADEKGRIKVGDVVEAANRANGALTTQAMYGKGAPVFVQLTENFIFNCQQWQGFNDRYWLAEGYAKWVEAGRPDDRLDFHSAHPYNRHFYNACHVLEPEVKTILDRINAASPAANIVWLTPPAEVNNA